MASVEKREDRGTWQVRWRVNGQQRAKGGFKTKTAAKAFALEVESAERKLDPRDGRALYRDWHERWTASRHGVKPATLATSASLAKNHTLPLMGDERMDAITQADVQAFVNALVKKGLSASTVTQTYKDFSQSFKAAVHAGLIKTSPCVGIALPKARAKELTVLDHDEIEELLTFIPEHYRPMVEFMAYTGLRIGEVVSLVPADIVGSVVHVTKTTSEIGGALVTSSPKTKAGNRRVPMTPHIRSVVEAHQKASPGTWVFSGTRGGQIRARGFYARVFVPAVKAYNAAREKRGEQPVKFTVHDLRHTAISQWLRNGVDLVRVKTWAGHESATFTVDRYGHFFVQDDEAILNMLDNARGKAVTVPN